MINFLLWTPLKPQSCGDQWTIEMFDVGHGLAVLIQKAGRAILYDTASSFNEESIAKRDLIPYIKYNRLFLDGMIISHDDNDHAGGLPHLRESFPNAWIRSAGRQPGALPCVVGENWTWQGLQFQPLWPIVQRDIAKNNDSCVLTVSDTHDHQLLLTGDLGKKGEKILVQQARILPMLQSTWLQVPHHGSNTSSSVAFLEAVMPEIAINSAGRYNRWQLPRGPVLDRYQQLGIPMLDTQRCGKVTIEILPASYQLKVIQAKGLAPWYYDLSGQISCQWHNE